MKVNISATMLISKSGVSPQCIELESMDDAVMICKKLEAFFSEFHETKTATGDEINLLNSISEFLARHTKV